MIHNIRLDFMSENRKAILFWMIVYSNFVRIFVVIKSRVLNKFKGSCCLFHL